MEIRPMQPEDAEAVRELALKTPEFNVQENESTDRHFFPLPELRDWAAHEEDVLLVAEEENTLLGFITSQLHQPTGKATIENVVVREESRQQGIGSELMKACLNELKENGSRYIAALTHVENSRAKTFLQQHGFEEGKDFTWMEQFTE